MDRRPSPYSQFGQSPYSGHIPLPHEDQAHFYAGGLPDLDSVVPLPQTGLSPGERGYYVGFDSLSTSGHGPSVSSENVLLIGEEGALRVYRTTRKAVDIVGRLEGLQGAVVGAKILPWTFRSDSALSGRPYVALILHGPVIPEDEAAASSDTSAAPSMEDNDTSPEPSTTRATAGQSMDTRDLVRQYQTTVEIYSLSTRQHVATIFKCPAIDIEYTHTGEIKVPPPFGDLRIDANGKFLVVASGTSGEVFVFTYFPRGPKTEDLQSIRCIGKLWTSVQPRDTKPATVSPNGETAAPTEEHDPCRVAMFSLSHRWIAVVPPPADSLFSMKGVASLASPEARPLGIRSHGPPPKPTTTCGLDTPESESLMDRVSREVTQQVMKGAQWAAEHGMQAWNNYWRPQQGNQPLGHLYVPDVSSPAFPPTHGVSQSPPSAASPTQVSIFDMQRLLDTEEMKVKNALTPLATFEPPSGCSYLSFAPSGLVLLTVSKKGDQQFVWSLMRMQHPRIGLTYDGATLPYVRQMHKVTRMTVASVVDVVWNTPQGNRFAVLTERGTIHIHEIPASAFQWPPSRRGRHRKQPPKSDNKDNDDLTGNKGPVSTALDTINGTSAWLRSMSTRPRSMGNAATFPAALMMTPAVTASVGGKVVKAGFSKGVSMVANSANTIYYASENKLHIGNLSNGISPGCIHWLSGRDQGYFAVVVTGTLSIYAVRQTRTAQKGKPDMIRARISKKPVEFGLHRISDNQFPPAFTAALEMRFQGTSKSTPPGIGGVWHLRAPASTMNAHTISSNRRGKKLESWHAMFETESNPPCQPFHTDRRATICAYPEPEGQAPTPPPQNNAEPEEFDAYEEELAVWQDEILDPWLQNTHHVLPQSHNHDQPPAVPWVFGEDVVSIKVLSGGDGVVSGDGFTDDDEVENKIHVINGLDGEQVHVTTVRRVGREEEDFFEDGCEVVEFADDRI
jgi:hypothetical protein